MPFRGKQNPMADEFDEQIKQLLPLPFEWFMGCEAVEDYLVERRPVVAAAFREAGESGARAVEANLALLADNARLKTREAELIVTSAKLRHEVERLQAIINRTEKLIRWAIDYLQKSESILVNIRKILPAKDEAGNG